MIREGEKRIDSSVSGEKPESSNEAIDSILEKSKEVQPEMESIYQDLHENPELGGEEFATAEKVKTYLESLGIEIMGDKIGGTGIVGIIRGTEGGPTVALRADMDALPIQENKDHENRSKKDGVMHACGHDAHTSGLMGAAKVLKDLSGKGLLGGDVVLLFQPSEEKAHQKQSGAVQMVKFLQESGLRDKIGAFFGLHVYGDADRGEVNVKEGVQTASSGEIDITLKGPGGHIMNVFDAPDLHRVFSKINLRLHDEFKPLFEKKEALVGSGSTDYGQAGYNILPAEVGSTWVVRVTTDNYKELSGQIKEKIKLAVEQAVKEELDEKDTSKGGIEIDIKARPGYRPVAHRDSELVNVAASSAQQTVDNFKRKEELLMGGEDFSFYLEKLRGKQIPGVFAMVGAANPEQGIPKASHHSPDFKIDRQVMTDLAALHSAFAVNAIEHLSNKG